MDTRRTADGYDHHRGAAPLLRTDTPWRTGLYLTLNFIVFAGVNVFWGHLGTGMWADFSGEAYHRSVITPLGETFLHPLSVLNYPWMVPVVGLLLGAMLFVPVITAVLYRSIFAAIFVLLLGVLGRAPILAAALGIGCFMSARTPLRSDTPFLAFILGILPAGAYFYFFGLPGGGSPGVLPLQRWVLVCPMLIAVVTAVLSAAAALGMAKLTHFRSGVSAPILLLLLSVPIGIFYSRSGPAELDYAFIVERLAPGDMIFQPITLERWRRSHGTTGLTDRGIQTRLRGDLQYRQHDLIERCENFVKRHPNSPRAAAVLWIEAQARSLELDVPALVSGTVRYSAGFVSKAAGAVWRRLREDYPASPHAGLADWRLGELAVRRGDLGEAEQRLHAADEALTRFLTTREVPSEAEMEATIFRPAESQPVPGYYTVALFSVRRLIWLMERNDVTKEPTVAEALTAWLNENPHEVNYDERLGRLVSLYEKTPLGDNLKLAVALATSDPYAQAEMLIYLSEDERTDAAVEANHQLGMLAMQTARARALPLVPKLQGPEAYFRIVTAAPPNPWTDVAREHLERLTKEPETER